MKKILALALSVSTIIGSFGAMTTFATTSPDLDSKEQHESLWSNFATTAKKISTPASFAAVIIIISIIECRKPFARRRPQMPIETAVTTAAATIATAAKEPSVADATALIAAASSPSTLAAVAETVTNAVSELPTVNELVQDIVAK